MIIPSFYDRNMLHSYYGWLFGTQIILFSNVWIVRHCIVQERSRKY